ncbi:hypothetical protein SAMN04488135_1221 [Pollutimonas bauzanensis]|uniref:Uncharacterized protein n=1 Tax=Pollutimonas bauzanensis TaxID=658167 RepID=A0A1M6AEG1_9BURK|nr:hypothetical protein SAMN04488135_1221 [Pollutimonas bauzanensis]
MLFLTRRRGRVWVMLFLIRRRGRVWVILFLIRRRGRVWVMLFLTRRRGRVWVMLFLIRRRGRVWVMLFLIRRRGRVWVILFLIRRRGRVWVMLFLTRRRGRVWVGLNIAAVPGFARDCPRSRPVSGRPRTRGTDSPRLSVSVSLRQARACLPETGRLRGLLNISPNPYPPTAPGYWVYWTGAGIGLGDRVCRTAARIGPGIGCVG